MRNGLAIGWGLVVASMLAVGSAAAQDVPLRLWTNTDFPTGLSYGRTNGVAFGDFDQDGYIDVFSYASGNLFRNLAGTSWQMFNINVVFPAGEGAFARYGSHFGDLNADGYPEIVTAPRGGCVHFLFNRGAGAMAPFYNRVTDPAIMDSFGCGIAAETICYADVDGDANTDVLVTGYPFPDPATDRNYFWHNLGPRPADGVYTFEETAVEDGLTHIYRGTAREEGAQFIDEDYDGDLDFYTSGLLFQNVSTVGSPDFNELNEMQSGILFRNELDEGAAFADYDMDGDYDLFVVYTSFGVCTQIHENRGDGTYRLVERTAMDSPCTGLNLGLSTEDWDNDGDMDLTTREVFRRNQLVETGTARFTVASHSIPGSHLTSATPSWGDTDKDGDLDSALGNWQDVGHFYENTTYGAATPDAMRRYLRVRAMRDSAMVPTGLETEFGANVEVVLRGDTTNRRRIKFPSTGGGYLNQNEYTLHFGLPADPDPAPEEDFHVDVHVDFPMVNGAFWRVDQFVNPALADINIADLAMPREITVFRSGAVEIDGVVTPPDGNEGPLLITAGGGLAQTSSTAVLARPNMTFDPVDVIAIDFDTMGADERVRIRQVIIDGVVADPVTCDGEMANVFLWDVTDATAINRGRLNVPPRARNDRTWVDAGLLLERDRHYRLLARVSSVRTSFIGGPVMEGDLTVQGGFQVRSSALDPCMGADAARPVFDPNAQYLSFRYAPLMTDPCDACTAAEMCDFDRCVPRPMPDAGLPDGGEGDGGGSDGGGTDGGGGGDGGRPDGGGGGDGGRDGGGGGGGDGGCCRVTHGTTIPPSSFLLVLVVAAALLVRPRRRK